MRNLIEQKQGKLYRVLLIFVALLIPLSIIAAETSDVGGSTSTAPETSTSDNSDYPANENSETTTPEETQTEPSTEETIPPEQNQTIPEEPVVEEIPETPLEIISITSESNESTPAEETPTEEIPEPEITNENSIPLPELEIQLSYPSKITRGEIIEAKAIISNSGATANNVLTTWILPENFKIISESAQNCEALENEESCTSTITIQTSLSTSLGINQIKAMVKYEN